MGGLRVRGTTLLAAVLRMDYSGTILLLLRLVPECPLQGTTLAPEVAIFLTPHLVLTGTTTTSHILRLLLPNSTP